MIASLTTWVYGTAGLKIAPAAALVAAHPRATVVVAAPARATVLAAVLAVVAPPRATVLARVLAAPPRTTACSAAALLSTAQVAPGTTTGKVTTGGYPVIRSAIDAAREEAMMVAATAIQEETMMVAATAAQTGALTFVATVRRTGDMMLHRTTCSQKIHTTRGVLPRMKVSSLEALVAGALTRRMGFVETLP